jgi:hypothetical protein
MELVSDQDQVGGLRSLFDEYVTGYEPQDYPDHCWILHPMYEPAPARRRIRWSEVMERKGRTISRWQYTLSDLVFDPDSDELPLERPETGTLDWANLEELVKILARHSVDGVETWCYWAQSALEDLLHPVRIRSGELRETPGLLDPGGDASDHWSFPANWWPQDRSWFMLSDVDLSATEVIGSPELIDEFLGNDFLEVIRHPKISESLNGTPTWS